MFEQVYFKWSMIIGLLIILGIVVYLNRGVFNNDLEKPQKPIHSNEKLESVEKEADIHLPQEAVKTESGNIGGKKVYFFVRSE